MAGVSRRRFMLGTAGLAGAWLAAACRPAERPVTQAPPPEATPAARAASVSPAGDVPGGQPRAGSAVPSDRPEYPFAITRRDEWGGRPPNLDARDEHGLFDPRTNPGGWEVYAQPLLGLLTTLVVHHSALPPSQGPRAIQALHMDQRGWADVGYHFVVGPSGDIYEGRDLHVRGRHVSGANTGTVGICLMGNFAGGSPPPDPQLAALDRLVAYLAGAYEMGYIAGHSDFDAGTQCPGSALYSHIPVVAERYGLLHSTRGYRTPAWALTPAPGRSP